MTNKKKKYYDGDIPFGIHAHYVNYPEDKTEVVYREQQAREHSWQQGFEKHPNCSFYANLQFDSMSRGRSAANFEAILHQVDGDLFPDGFLEGCHVNIFMVDMLEIIQNTCITHGFTGTHLWTFCKRGSNYGIQLVNG